MWKCVCGASEHCGVFLSYLSSILIFLQKTKLQIDKKMDLNCISTWNYTKILNYTKFVNFDSVVIIEQCVKDAFTCTIKPTMRSLHARRSRLRFPILFKFLVTFLKHKFKYEWNLSLCGGRMYRINFVFTV